MCMVRCRECDNGRPWQVRMVRVSGDVGCNKRPSGVTILINEEVLDRNLEDKYDRDRE